MQSIHLHKQANIYSYGSETGLYVYCSGEDYSCYNTEIYVTNTSDPILSCPYNCTSASIRTWIPPTTASPTQNPYLATISPSQQSSSSPSRSSTICADTFMNIQEINYTYSKSEIFAMNETDTINCTYNGHCSDYTLNISDQNQNVSSLNFDCDSKDSSNLFIIDIINSSLNTINIWCNNIDSCKLLHLNISDSNINSVNIYCLEIWSCYSLSLYSFNSGIIANLFCIKHNACSDLNIRGDSEMFLNINIYKYSDSINIIHPNITNINLNCNDYNLIKYDTQIIPNRKDLLDLARDEYDYRKLSCDGNIKFYSPSDKLCETQYQLKPFDLTQIIIEGQNNIECVWMQIDNIFEVNFIGNCFQRDKIQYYIYDMTLSYIMIFKTDSVEINGELTLNNDRSLLICQNYFDNLNDTYNTLISMDSIFEYVLILIDYNESYPINDIIKAPFTKLLDIQSLHCDDTFTSIAITIDLSVSSTKDKSTVYGIFGDDNIFVSRSQLLLSNYFNIELTIIDNIENVEIVESEQNIEIIVIISLSVILCIFMVICIIYKCRHHYKTVKISNPMVIMLGIAHYDEDTKNSQINGYLSNLDGIDIDIKNVIQLFENTLNYSLFPECNINGKLKQYWTKQEILDIMNEKSAELSINIGKNKNYDGLVVIFSGHGIDNSIISSDYKKIDKHRIQRIFARAHDNQAIIRTIPRLFIFDSCTGINEREAEFRDASTIEEEPSSSSEEESTNAKGAKKDESEEKKKQEIVQRDSRRFTELQSWKLNEDNPDFNSIIFNSSNKDFQSKLSSEKGSLFMTRLIKGIERNNNGNCFKNKRYLSKIFGSIQSELHKRGKQLPEDKYYNHRNKNIIFVKKTDESLDNDISKQPDVELAKTIQSDVNNEETVIA